MNSDDEKACQFQWQEKSCQEPFYKQHESKPYCVLHFPDVAKKEQFEKALEKRLDPENENYLNFVGVWFPDLLSFLNQTFSALVDFSGARFTLGAEFTESQFLEARFVNAQFDEPANFMEAQFEGIADFSGARFQKEVTFSRASFSDEGRFFRTQFEGFADFAGVQIDGDASFRQAVFNYADFGELRIPLPKNEGKPGNTSKFEAHRSKFKKAQFNAATFVRCSFKHACFSEQVEFLYAQVTEFCDFSIVDFNRADFSNSHLAQATFDGSFFLTAPKFNQCQMYGNTNFSTARMPGGDFSEVAFHGHVDFTVTRFVNSLWDWEKDRLRGV